MHPMTPPPGVPNKPRPWLAIGIVVALAILAGNLGAYVVYRSSRPKPAAITVVPSEPPLAAEATPPGTSIQDLAIEQREDGVRALRSGDYSRAIASFEAALRMDPDVADAEVLRDVARRLLDAESTKATKREPVKRRTVRTQPARRIVRRSEPRAKAKERTKKPRESTRTGSLLVTTVPERVLIELDGRPVELAPARIELNAGRHRVRLRRGRVVLLDKNIDIRAGKTEVIEEDFTTRLADAEPPPSSTKASSKTVARDSSLDLLALVDRNAPRTPATDAAPSARRAARDEAPTPSGRPGLLVYWPGRTGTDVQRSLGSELQGIQVEVTTRAKAFRRALEKGPDAVMASSSVLRQNGLSPRLTGANRNALSGYMAASLKKPVTPAELGSATLGIVDELGRRRTPIFVARLLGVAESPKLRRVAKVEDLLPLLQFSMARAVLVRESELDVLRSRTKQKLYTVAVRPPEQVLAVAIVDTGRGTTVERALLGMQEKTKKALGVDSWKR